MDVQPFEDELGRAGGGRVAGLAVLEVGQRAARPSSSARLRRPGTLAIRSSTALAGEHVADLDALARLEVVDDRAELADVEVVAEDVLDRLVDDPVDQLVFVPLVLGHRQLELAARAGARRSQVGDPRHDPALRR